MPKWEKGQTGNPNGRPRGERSLAEALRHELRRRPGESPETNRERIAKRLVELAFGEDERVAIAAIRTIFERADGPITLHQTDRTLPDGTQVRELTIREIIVERPALGAPIDIDAELAE